MREPLLLATDLDRTLLPNGPEPESAGARQRFARLAARAEVVLAYVTGRHRALIEQAMAEWQLPVPDYVIGDVGTTIYHLGPRADWDQPTGWELRIGKDWGGRTGPDLAALLADVPQLRLQEAAKQNRHKLSYYVPLEADPVLLEPEIQARLAPDGVHARLIWSVDDPAAVGLLDIVPRSASKLHALEALAQQQGFTPRQVVFCGDSGNDLEVLASAIPAVLVANAQPAVQARALEMAAAGGQQHRLYIARGSSLGMNGNYSGGILEGVAHFRPEIAAWLAEEA